MKKYNKYIFKKSPILIFDFLKVKLLPKKALENFQKKTNDNIKVNYYVNQLADKLHPNFQNVTIDNIIDFNDDCKSFVLKGDKNQLAYFRSGQYITLNVNIDGVVISRPYSIVSSPLDALNKNIYVVTMKKANNGFFSKYMFEKAKIGDKLTVSGPQGEFYYDPLRDHKHIIGLAGGIGITPFMSIAKDIFENNLDVKLTILWCTKTKDQLIYFDELKKYQTNPKIQVKFFTTQEKCKDTLNCRINDDILNEYINSPVSYYICGSQKFGNGMYQTLLKSGIESKYIRMEANELMLPSHFDDYKNINKKLEYKMKVHLFDNVYTINANAEDSILVSLQKAKLHTQSRCMNGKCSWCRIRVIKGQVYTPKKVDLRREKDKLTNIYHSCVSFPVSDIEIESY